MSTARETPFVAFVHEHARSLHGTALALTGDRHAAEELVQDTLSHLYPRWAAVESADSPVAYVRRSVVNRFLGARRRPGWPGDTGRAQVVSRTPDVAELVGDRLLITTLLDTLSHNQRAAVVLRFLDGWSDPEIARALGCRAVTVRSLVSRGLAAMRAQALIEPDPDSVGGKP